MPEEIEDNLTLVERIKKAWNDDPAIVILAASSVIFATAKLVDSASMASSRRISNKQSKYYLKQSKKQKLHLPPFP